MSCKYTERNCSSVKRTNTLNNYTKLATTTTRIQTVWENRFSIENMLYSLLSNFNNAQQQH